jgi:hypothetical protein
MLTSDPLAGTFAGLYIDGESITVSCSPCDKRVDIDLLKMPLLEHYVGRKFRCSTCGQRGQMIIGAAYTNRRYSFYKEEIDAECDERRRQIEERLKREK